MDPTFYKFEFNIEAEIYINAVLVSYWDPNLELLVGSKCQLYGHVSTISMGRLGLRFNPLTSQFNTVFKDSL